MYYCLIALLIVLNHSCWEVRELATELLWLDLTFRSLFLRSFKHKTAVHVHLSCIDGK